LLMLSWSNQSASFSNQSIPRIFLPRGGLFPCPFLLPPCMSITDVANSYPALRHHYLIPVSLLSACSRCILLFPFSLLRLFFLFVRRLVCAERPLRPPISIRIDSYRTGNSGPAARPTDHVDRSANAPTLPSLHHSSSTQVRPTARTAQSAAGSSPTWETAIPSSRSHHRLCATVTAGPASSLSVRIHSARD